MLKNKIILKIEKLAFDANETIHTINVILK